MTILKYLQYLKENNIKLEVTEGQIRIIADKNKISPILIEDIKSKKNEIIDFLTLKNNAYSGVQKSEADVSFSFPVSSVQYRMYLLYLKHVDSIAYNVRQAIPLSNSINLSKIEKILSELISRHENLRSSFHLENDEINQVVHSVVELKLNVLKYNSLAGKDTLNFEKLPFDLGNAPLFRASILEDDQNNHTLLIDFHHIIIDGISLQILQEEFLTLYNGEQLEPLEFQYRDYCLWQKTIEYKKIIAKQEEYWLGKFEKYIPEFNLPRDYNYSNFQVFDGATLSFKLSENETNLIKKFSENLGITLYVFLASCLKLFLSKVSSQEEIVIGTIVSGRRTLAFDRTVGMFSNTLVLHSRINPTFSIKEFLLYVKQSILEAFDNQDYPFELLVENINKDSEYYQQNPIFNVCFTHDNIYSEINNIYKDAPSEFTHTPGIAKFDLYLGSIDLGNQILLNLNYNTSIYKNETIEVFAKCLLEIIKQFVKDPRLNLKDIELIDDREKQKLLIGFNNTFQPYPNQKCIHQLFEEQAKRNPTNIAVEYENEHITYLELSRRSDHLASILSSEEFKNEQIIAINESNLINTCIGILGILKSCKAYLPVDQFYPRDRLHYLWKKCKIKTIVSSDSKTLIANFELRRIDIGKLDCAFEQISFELAADSSFPAYLIFTSGSTGQPKGVVIRHSSVVNLISNQIAEFNIKCDDRVFQFSSISFDASVEQIWLALLTGSTLVGIDKEKLVNMDNLEEAIEALGVTHLHATPSFLLNLDFTKMPSLRRVVSGGESCPVELAKMARSCSFYNEYGPTETTVTSIMFRYDNSIPMENSVLIGKPIRNTYAYIVNSENLLMPIGIPGELCLGGAGLAIGYYDEVDLTKDKFIDSPFEPGGKLYKTGDKVRWLPDGNIEFLGRIDDQIKIRGFRVELNEIRKVLLNNEKVKDCEVLVLEHTGDKVICAYVVLNSDTTVEFLREYLEIKLPYYMIPYYFVILEKMPVNRSGKVDKKNLPLPYDGFNNTNTEILQTYGNEIERKIMKIWSEVLNIQIDSLDTMSNFFKVGGHSLKIVKVLSKIKSEFDVIIRSKDLYDQPVIKDIAQKVIVKKFWTNEIVYFNKESKLKIFCFPPIVGFGYCYSKLANHFPEYCLCAFNFIEEKSTIDFYVNKMIDLQPNSSFVLLAYSAGAKLLYAVAQELEKRGKVVAKIILIDGYWNYRGISDRSSIMGTYDKWILDLNIEYLKTDFYNRIYSYDTFLKGIELSGVLNSDIHFLLSQGHDTHESYEHLIEERERVIATLGNYTQMTCFVYDAIGLHRELLDDEMLNANALIIKKILEKQV